MKKAISLFISSLIVFWSYAQDSYDSYGKDGVPSGDHTPTTAIDGLLYKLNEATFTAMVANGNSWEGELNIPEQVTYDGKTYTVDRIEWNAFDNCKTLSKVRIPKTVTDIRHYCGIEWFKNPFKGCTSLECIEVDNDNQCMCSAGGILFSKDKTQLYCYPAGLKSETYNVPDCVSWIGNNAFAHNSFLVKLTIPNSVTYISSSLFKGCESLQSISISEGVSFIEAYTFENCKSLKILDIPKNVRGFGESVFRWSPIKTLVIRGSFPDGFRYDTFDCMDDEVVIYVQRSEMEKLKSELKKVRGFSGTVLPLESYTTVSVDKPSCMTTESSIFYDLQGRRINGKQPRKGVYIRDGRKVVVK